MNSNLKVLPDLLSDLRSVKLALFVLGFICLQSKACHKKVSLRSAEVSF